jgi:Domain of unknown function (DUF4173)
MISATGTKLNGPSWGHKIPGTFSTMQWRVIAVVAAALWAALISGADHIGSVAALCFAIPYLVMLCALKYRATAGKALQSIATALPALAIIAVAIEPGPLNVTVAWLSLGVLAALMAGADITNALHVLRNLVLRLLTVPLQMKRETKLMRWLRKRQGLTSRITNVAAMVLPVAAVFIFGVLLSVANPLIAEVLTGPGWFDLFSAGTFRMAMIFALTAAALWPLLKLKTTVAPEEFTDANTPRWHRTFFQPVSVAFTLLFLNILFGWENWLDFQHVWQEGALPTQFTHAEYVHRGAYTLIATVMLAAALMIFALWPKTRTAETKAVRQLVYLWIVQNMLLVASSAKRTLAYIDDYGMSEWRLSGLVWMGLVGFGLLSICWHVLHRRSNRWLINSNLIASFLLLLVCGFVDGRAIVANWNVERAIASQNHEIDFDYLVDLGPSAIPAIAKLGSFVTSNPAINRYIVDVGSISSAPQYLNWKLSEVQKMVFASQSDWRSWTLRYALLPS